MSFSKLFWGLIIIFIGICLLLTNFDLMSAESLAHIWRFWPVFLVVIGLSIMAKGSGKILGGLLGAIGFLILIGLFATFIYPPTRAYLTKESVDAKVTNISEPLSDGAELAKIDILAGATNLTIAGGSSQLVEGRIESGFADISTKRSTENNTDTFKISSHGFSIPFYADKDSWNLKVTDQLPIDLSINVGAVDANIDLSKTKVQKLDFKAGATDAEVTFPSQMEKIEASFQAGASDIKLRIPGNVGLKINTQTGLSSKDFGAFDLKQEGNVYQSANFETAKNKIELTIKTGAASIELEKI